MADTSNDKLFLTEEDLDAAVLTFDDYKESQVGMPDLDMALDNVATDTIIGILVSNVKAALLRVKAELLNKIDISKISENLTTETSGNVLAASQGKILNDNKIDISKIQQSTNINEYGYLIDGKTNSEALSTITTSLNTQLNYGYRVRRGSSSVTIDSDGFGVINHNGGFTNSGSYDCICNVNGLVLVNHWNTDGNKTNIGVKNINSSGQLIAYSGTISVQWIAVGK